MLCSVPFNSIYVLRQARCACIVFNYFFTIQSPNDCICNSSSYICHQIQQRCMYLFLPPLVAAIRTSKHLDRYCVDPPPPKK
mmetsp:Transcript_13228/g.26855  ORF Transcript_13228/g.26855 Transcript_13228/m.26855 type:complete len:82 (+) Transcript_13228:1719-1964(+)